MKDIQGVRVGSGVSVGCGGMSVAVSVGNGVSVGVIVRDGVIVGVFDAVGV